MTLSALLSLSVAWFLIAQRGRASPFLTVPQVVQRAPREAKWGSCDFTETRAERFGLRCAAVSESTEYVGCVGRSATPRTLCAVAASSSYSTSWFREPDAVSSATSRCISLIRETRITTQKVLTMKWKQHLQNAWARGSTDINYSSSPLSLSQSSSSFHCSAPDTEAQRQTLKNTPVCSEDSRKDGGETDFAWCVLQAHGDVEPGDLELAVAGMSGSRERTETQPIFQRARGSLREKRPESSLKRQKLKGVACTIAHVRNTLSLPQLVSVLREALKGAETEGLEVEDSGVLQRRFSPG